MKKILIVAAHPDDEVLGCSGTVTRLIEQGAQAYTLILGEGITSRDDIRDSDKRRNEISKLREEIHEANQIIGVDKVFIENLPDNRFDTIPFLDIVKLIEKVKDEIKPDTIFTHYQDDLNIDHQITCRAVLTAARPLADETVKEIYSFEVLSSTEWSFPSSFSPNTFYDISDTIDKKLLAMSMYKSELREYPHPRSLDGIKCSAQCNGIKIGANYAEAFKLLRQIK